MNGMGYIKEGSCIDPSVAALDEQLIRIMPCRYDSGVTPVVDVDPVYTPIDPLPKDGLPGAADEEPTGNAEMVTETSGKQSPSLISWISDNKMLVGGGLLLLLLLMKKKRR